MLLLAFDTSTAAVSVALADVATDGGCTVLAESTVVDARRHGELLAPGIAAVLGRAGVARTDLGAVAVGLGPGPFTGLRVGVVTAAALADALGIPAYGECSLDLLAAGRPGSLVVTTDARRREVYWAGYVDGVRVQGPYVDRPAAVRVDGRPVVGPGAVLYPDQLPGEPAQVNAAALAALVGPRAVAGLAAVVSAARDPLVPLYLRRPDAVPAVPVPAGAAP